MINISFKIVIPTIFYGTGNQKVIRRNYFSNLSLWLTLIPICISLAQIIIIINRTAEPHNQIKIIIIIIRWICENHQQTQ